jgi:transposase
MTGSRICGGSASMRSATSGHRYLTVVVDHDTGRLVWAAPGREKATLAGFFDALGEQRCAAITHVSADAADWIADVVALRCPNAVQSADPFHVVRWASEALDEVRKQVINQARAQRACQMVCVREVRRSLE